VASYETCEAIEVRETILRISIVWFGDRVAQVCSLIPERGRFVNPISIRSESPEKERRLAWLTLRRSGPKRASTETLGWAPAIRPQMVPSAYTACSPRVITSKS